MIHYVYLRILSLEQYLYHVISVKPLHPRNRLQASIITEAIVLLIWKVFWIHIFPPMLGNVNRAAATGISPVSAVETILSYSTKGIKLRDVNHSWYFRHLKMGYFKLLHNSGGYLYISEKASFQLSRINSSPQFHMMKKSVSLSMAGTSADICTLAAPSLRTRLGSRDDGWHEPTSENMPVSVEACDDQRLQVLSYQSVSSLDTSRENVLFSHSNNCMSLWLFASSQMKHRPHVSQKREDGDLALSCHLACWPEF